jgi:hypothetical protein
MNSTCRLLIGTYRLLFYSLAGLCSIPGNARAAQPVAGFPLKASGPLSGPVAVAPGETTRLFFAAGGTLDCATLAGRHCEGFPVMLGDRTSVVVGAPALGDVDGDRQGALAAALSDGRILLLKASGALRASFSLKSGFSAGPALIDVDGDGKAELVVGTRDGRLHALRANGAELSGFPVALSAGPLTSPASAALFGQGGKLALFVGAEDGKVYGLDASGKALPGFPVISKFMVTGQPALGDLEGEGRNALAFASQDFRLYAARADGKPWRGFPAMLGARVVAGVALADLEGDGALEIIAAAADGRLHAVGADGQEVKGFPVKLAEKLVGAPVAADLDRDGKEEILAASADGQLHVLRANGRPFGGFPVRLAGEAVAGPSVLEWGDSSIIVQGSADQLIAFRVKRAGKASGPLAWPEPGHDSARSGRVHPNSPRYVDLALTPAKPGTDDVLKASYRFFDLDGDPEPATELRWLRDGKEVVELSGKREVPPALTRKKERWRFQVSAPGGAPRPSPEGVIANSPPGRARLALEPLVMRRSEPVKVRIAEEAPDADGDKVTYRYLWLREGQPQKGLTGPSLPAGTAKRGERWTAVVVASDGEVEGPPSSVETRVEDSAPSAPEVALLPAAPKAGDAVKAIIQRPATDVDGDPIRYRTRFFVDGVEEPFASTLDTLPRLIARKKQGVAVEVRADDGELLGPPARAQVTVVNTPPTPPSPALFPREPTRADTLVAGLAGASLDVDRDKLTYRFAFSRDGKKVAPSADGRSVGPLKKGESWEVEVVASDGEADSVAARAKATVKNSPPTAPVIAFEALPLRRADSVRVRIATPATDPDGDKVSYAWSWTKDGVLQKERTGPELPAGAVRKGERWIATATPTDGEANGPSASVEARVVDSAPSPPQIALVPAQPRTGDAVKAVIKVASEDVDQDPLRYRYRFTVDGTPVALDDKADTLPALWARKKQQIAVEVQADDGEIQGPSASAKATVVNTPPEAPKASLLPLDPRKGDLLEAGLAAAATDADGDKLTYRFSLLRDGKKVPASAEGRELAGLKKGETYELEVVASDGEADSPPARAKVSVRNTPPTAPAISFSARSPRSGEAVEVRVDRPAQDADGDAVTLEIALLVDGKSAALSKDVKAIPAGRIKKHEVWTVEVTPSDGAERGPAGKARLTAINTAPTAPRVAIEPVEPTAESGAKARMLEASKDLDGDKLVYRYAWYRDGVRLPLPDSADQVAPGTLRRGESLRLVVAAFDGEEEGPPASAAAVVKNSPPSAPQIAIRPERPKVSDELLCAVTTPARDPDQEQPVLRFRWLRDGEPYPAGADQDRVAAGTARHGETWACEVVATDGQLSSAPAHAKAKGVNTPPGAPSPLVEPESPHSGQDLLCRLQAPALDADADPVAYSFRWKAGGKVAAGDAKEPWRLPASQVRKGQAYQCEVAPRDPESQGSAASAEARYRNSPPSRPTVKLMPLKPTAGAELTCEITAQASDPDGDAVRYRHRWLKNGVEQPFAESSAQVPARLVKAGDLWRCAVLASDGELEGTAAESEDVLVAQAPSASRVGALVGE